MKNENSPFNGFSEPKHAFHKIGHSWFDLWTKDLEEMGSKRKSLLIVTEYLLKNDWFIEKTGKQGCSFLEIRRGIMHPIARCRIDKGTNLDARVIKKSLKTLLEKNMVIQVCHQEKCLYRINREFFPEVFVNKDLSNSSEIDQDSTFFKVPNYAFELYKQTDSLAVILLLGYLFRHSWGYKNNKGVWLTAEEFMLGRERYNGMRYDNGIGFDKSTIYGALNECCSKGWIVVKRKSETGYTSDLYNLRIEEQNNAVNSGLPVTKNAKQEPSGNNPNIQNPSVKKENVKDEEQDRDRDISPIVSDYRNIDWVLLEDFSCVNADDSWVNAYSNWLNADPFCTNAISIKNLNNDTSWVDVNISRATASSSCDNANDLCEDAEEMQVKETLNTQSQRNIVDTTTNKNSDILDQKLAVAVVNGNQKKFLLSIGITGSSLGEILELNLPDEYLFGWALFNSTNHNCKSKSESGFIVNRLRSGDSPDFDCLSIGRLIVRDWIEIINVFLHHYSMSSSYIPEELEDQANFLRSSLFPQRESKLPKFLNKFTKQVQYTQEDQYE